MCLANLCVKSERGLLKLNKSRIFEIVVPSTQCFLCKHSNHETLQCPAVGEEQIPEDIQYNLRDCHYPYPGDHNVRFEEISKPLATSDTFIQTTKGEVGR